MLALDDRATLRFSPFLANQVRVDRTFVALYAPGKVGFRSRLTLLLEPIMIAFLTSPAPAGDEERS